MHRETRRAAAWALTALLVAAAPAGAEPRKVGQDAVDLAGTWRVEVVAGGSVGDHARMAVKSAGIGEDGARFYDGRMSFTDSRADASAEQKCVLKEMARQVTIRCSVDAPNWAPDDFDLTVLTPDRMEGAHSSIFSGEAVFLREHDEPVS